MNLIETLRKAINPAETFEGIVTLIQNSNATIKGRGAVTAPYKGALRIGDHAYIVDGVITRKPDTMLIFMNLPQQYDTVVIYGVQSTD